MLNAETERSYGHPYMHVPVRISRSPCCCFSPAPGAGMPQMAARHQRAVLPDSWRLHHTPTSHRRGEQIEVCSAKLRFRVNIQTQPISRISSIPTFRRSIEYVENDNLQSSKHQGLPRSLPRWSLWKPTAQCHLVARAMCMVLQTN